MSYRSLSQEGPTIDMGSEGIFDYPNERGLMTISGPDAAAAIFGEGVVFEEFRLLGRTGYIRWTVKGKSYWVKEEEVETSSNPAELLIPFPGSPTKPTDVLTRALLASVENEELGAEEVRGTQTTHYRAKVDTKKLVAQLPEAERPKGDLELWDARFVPVEIWIDDESRLRRIKITQASVNEGDAGETMTMDVELFDYGVEFDVETPPADQIITQEEFDKLVDQPVELESGWGERVCEAREKKPDRACLEAKEKE